MKIRRSRIIVELTEHLDKKAVFYAFVLNGVKAEEVIPWLEKVLADLKGDHTILYKEETVMKPRPIDEVLEKIIREVPQDWPGRAYFIGRLRSIISSSKYTAPEDMARHWNEAAVVMESRLGDPDEEWKRRVASIFAGRSSI